MNQSLACESAGLYNVRQPGSVFCNPGVDSVVLTLKEAAMHSKMTLASWVLPACIGGCTSVTHPPLEVVEFVDLARYTGKWYEIARYPAPFQEGCVATTAEYTLRPDGKIQVVNRCRAGCFDGRERRAEGVARVVGDKTNAKLKVSFFWPFEGDYWIIDLDDDYQWAVVGEPCRRFLWVLSRTPTLDGPTYEAILSRLPDKGYDPARLEKTRQPPGNDSSKDQSL